MSELDVEPGTTGTRAAGPTALPPAIVFALALLFVSLSFGSAILLMTRSVPGAGASAEPAAAASAQPAAAARTSTTASRTATATPAPARVVSASGTAEPLGSGTYRVVFTWVLEGATEGDVVLFRFSMGSRIVSERRGTLDANVFVSSTGRLTVATSQDCSTDGWTAQLVTLRGVSPAGEATARVAGVRCA